MRLLLRLQSSSETAFLSFSKITNISVFSHFRFSFAMASLPQFLLILSLLSYSILLIRCDDEEDNLLQGINQYRTSLNLTALTKNNRAECLADELANQFKGQPCTNSTGANTVPGTEPQNPNFPKFLTKCHLNVTTTRDGQIMPACVPNLDRDLVLTNFTKSQYSENLNDTQYTGIGIGSEGNWIVVVLTTSTPEGNYAVGTNMDNNEAMGLGGFRYTVFLVVGVLMLL